MFRHAVRTLFALVVAMAPALCEAALYRWVDELGVTHYTTDLDTIPSGARDNALEIIVSPPPVSSTRAVPVPPVPPEEVAPEPPSQPAPELAPPIAPPEVSPAERAAPEPAPAERVAPEPAPIEPAASEPAPAERVVPEPALSAPVATESPALAPDSEPPAEVPAVESPPPAPGAEPPSESQSAPPVFPGPSNAPDLLPGDPRAAEVAQLEAKIAADREQLRQMISTKRWDSAELASDPEIREIAERLPRLQAELAALRAETVH